MPPAIVLDGEQKSALAAVRSLGEKGIPVVAAGKRATGIALHSRYASHTFLYADPLRDKQQFVDDVIAEAKKYREKHSDRPVILAMSDQTASALFERRREMEAVGRIVWPSDESFITAFDKEKTLRLAQSLSVPIPETHFDAAQKPARFPAVLKPRRSSYWQSNEGFRTTAMFAMNERDLADKSRRFFERAGEHPLVQEYVRGEEYGVEAFCDNGRIIALSAHRRIRSLSPVGGASVLRETIDAGVMTEYAERILGALSWTGPAMTEFKKDENSGEYVLMEVNGRFWGSLPLNIFAGTDFPYLYYERACGRSPMPQLSYRTGVMSRHFLGDVKHLLAVLFAGDPMRPYMYPSRLRALKEFLLLPKGKIQSDVFSWRDLRPSLFQYLDRFAQAKRAPSRRPR